MKNQITLSIGHYGENYLRTKLELKGRGITMVGDKTESTTGTYLYRVTDKALAAIEQQNKVDYKY